MILALSLLYYGDYILMVQFVAMAKVLVLFIYLHMGLVCEASCRLKYFRTMIKAEYALLFGLELCLAIGSIHIEASGDSLLVVQQISKGYHCFDESLIVYLEVRLNRSPPLRPLIYFYTGKSEDWRKFIVDYLQNPSKKGEQYGSEDDLEIHIYGT